MNVIAHETASVDVEDENTLIVVQDIWAGVLGANAASANPNTDFFDLGGNSLLLIALLEGIQNKLGVVISTNELSEGVTVERLTRLVREKATAG